MSDEGGIPAKNYGLKVVALLAPISLSVLLLGAILFYKERMLYIDAPHVLFRIINDGHLWIEEHRYGSFISQALPFIGVKLHLPLQWLMILYSVSFYLFYLTVSLILFFTCRNYGLTILLGLYFTVFVSVSYYWPNNEVHQGMAWLLLAFAVTFSVAEKNKNLWITLPLFVLLFFIAIWTHPLVMLAAIYLWFFYMGDKALWPFTKVESIVFSVVLLVLAYVKFYQGMHHGYDSSKIDAITHIQPQRIRHIMASPQLHLFLNYCVKYYWLFVLLFIAGLIGLIRERKFVLLAWALVFVAGYLALTSITFWDVTSRLYMECEYMPLVIICCAPFVYYVLPKMNVKLGVVLFVLISMLRLAVIYKASGPFTYRIAMMENVCKKMKEKELVKVIIPEPVPVADSVLMANWAAPVESIFISKLNGEMPQRTFVFISRDQLIASDTVGKDVMIGCWERRDAGHLNSHYFQIDTTTAYKVVDYNLLME